MSGVVALPQNALQKDALDKETPTFSVSVEVVNASVTVRDKKGAFIKDLTQEDFTLKEDGRKQTISNFSREYDLPLTIGLVIDTSPSMGAVMGELQIATRLFLKKIIRPEKDSVFIIRFGDTISPQRSYEGWIELVQGLTSSPQAIEKAANRIGLDYIAGTATQAEFLTMLADSIYIASKRILMPLQGRKALVIIGDGYHLGENMDMAIAAAQEADTLIYSIRMHDPRWGGANSMGGMGGMFGGMGRMDPAAWEHDLRTLSRKTGGSYFEGIGGGNLLQIFTQIEEELRSIYSLGYTPDKSTNRGFRKIKVEVKKPGMEVSAREGYTPRNKK